jgi:hypothetical protein
MRSEASYALRTRGSSTTSCPSLSSWRTSCFVCFARAAPVSEVVVLSEVLVGHFALKQLVTDHHDGVSHCYRCLLRATPPSDTSVVRREVSPLGTRCAACAASVSALLSHLEPLRVVPERRLPAYSSLPGHILKHTRRGERS